MSYQAINNGIAAIQAGDVKRGGDILRAALTNASITGSLRAIALMWLAETSTDLSYKFQCYQLAVQADPTNQDAINRMNALAASQMQVPPQIPTPPPPMDVSGMAVPRPPAHNLPGTGPLAAPQSDTGRYPPAQANPAPPMWEFGIVGHNNGTGTAFMVVRSGYLATTRFIVGDQQDVTLLTHDNRQLEGEVVRSYPEYDLAFIRTRMEVPYVRDDNPAPAVPANAPLITLDFQGHTQRAACRGTRRTIQPGWFPTTFQETLGRSFSGAPIVDEHGDLVGMLTRNSSRSSGYLYGLHISVIRKKIAELFHEMQTDRERIYCGTCGCRSKAGAEGLYYCEVCGALFPFARRLHRTPHPRGGFYYDSDLNR